MGNKEDITIADVMRHEAGMPYFDKPLKGIEEAWPENIKSNSIGQLVAAQTPFYPAETKRQYHSMSRGIIANEIIRRVDPQGRTIGEILNEDVQIDGIHCGLSDDQKKSATLSCPSMGFMIGQSLLPKWAGRKVPYTFPILLSALKAFGKTKTATPLYESANNDPGNIAGFVNAFNEPEARKAEFCSGTCQCTARGLGKLAAVMANKGEAMEDGGQPLISASTWNEMHSKPTSCIMEGFGGIRTTFTQGGLAQCLIVERPSPQEVLFMKDREGFYGWGGLGGSIFQWHPELKIGFAFVPTRLLILDIFNARGAVLQDLVKKCVIENQK